MQIQINIPFGYNELGGRSNNEDSVFPIINTASENDRLFLVCDGVGGAAKGEIASQLACKGFSEYFINNNITYSDKKIIGEALDYTEQVLDDYLAVNPTSKGMGTTVTLLHIHSGGVTIAHIGDSRIYQIRGGSIIQQTKDHSLAMELFSSGIITLEQAREHPRRNEITRALQGKSVRQTKAEVLVIDDIQIGDYFFLCTDGVLEKVDENILEDLTKQYDEPETIVTTLRELSMGQTRDNFSAYLIKIKDIVEAKKSDITTEITEEAPPLQVTSSEPTQQIIPTMPKKKSNKILIWVISLIILVGLFIFGFWVVKNHYPQLLDNLLTKQTDNKTSKISQTEISKIPIVRKLENADTVLKANINKIDIEENKIENKKTQTLVNDTKTEWNKYLYKVTANGLFGLVNSKGKEKLPVEFQEIGVPTKKKDGGNEFIQVKKDNKYSFIIIPNGKGVHLISEFYDKILKFDSKTGEATVISNGEQKTVFLKDLLKEKSIEY